MFRDHNQRSDRAGGRARRQRCHSRRRRSSADGGATRSRVAPSPVPSPHALTGHEPTVCSGVRAPGCQPCAHEPLATRPAGDGPPTQGRDLRRAASGFPIGTSTVHRCVREAIKLLAAMAPTPASRSRSRADRAPLHGRTRQPPSTSWVTSSSTFTSATETPRDAQLIHIRERRCPQGRGRGR